MQVNYCRVCFCDTGTIHVVREMKLGTRDEFLYFECSACGCLSLLQAPANVSLYYPPDYYMLDTRSPSLARHIRDRLYLSPLSFLVNWRRRTDLDVMRRLKLNARKALLEVGCGSGGMLLDLREIGFNALGVDPFIRSNVKDRFGVRVERKCLEDVEGKFDVIFFRHSLERMPIDALKTARSLINQDGSCVVCIALLGWAWKTYGTDWVQLDAPRNLVVHSYKSFSLLAENSGFTIDKIVFDSTELQFWASDSFQRDVPMCEMQEPGRSQRSRMRRLASSLNRKQQGDTAQFYLKPCKLR